MNKEISIHLTGRWVLEHRNDDVRPIDFLKNTVRDKLQDRLSIKDSGLTTLCLTVTDESADAAELLAVLRNAFLNEYSLEDNDDVITAEVTTPDADDEKKDDGEDHDLDGGSFFSRLRRPEEKQKPETVEECMAKIGALAGAGEFKALAKELCEIAPQIIENKTYDAFLYQTYLFSLNDGYGLSTSLSCLASLLSALKVVKIASSSPIEEVKLDPPKGDRSDPLSEIERQLENGRKDAVTVLSIDISAWMNDVGGRQFRELLMGMDAHQHEFVFVFRVPFVDKDVLEKVRSAINDVMFVRTISFPPFTKVQIRQCAEHELNKYGFRLSAPAWELFHERVALEKSDGRFYGVNTVRKVVRELLYKKQLSNARRGKNDLLISRKDMQAICAVTEHNSLSGYEMLDRMIGGEALKDRINEIVSQILLARSEAGMQAPCIHMRFVGNPGTGKTTVARIVGKILKEKGVLRVGNFYEYSGRDFCGRYIGETAPKTASMCRDAYGSVLFIDEAYSLYRGDDGGRDYGREALDTLIAEMENHRSDLVVIMAGYTDDMNRLMEGNAGLASRMPYTIEFPNFTREQLYQVFVSMLGQKTRYEEDLLPAVKDYFDRLPDEILSAKEFSNARFVRNLYERTWAKASMRCELGQIPTVTLIKDDFERSSSDKEFTFTVEKKNRIGFAG